MLNRDICLDCDVLQWVVLSVLLPRLQACWTHGDHDIQVKICFGTSHPHMDITSNCPQQNAGSRSDALWHHLLHLPHGFWAGILCTREEYINLIDLLSLYLEMYIAQQMINSAQENS